MEKTFIFGRNILICAIVLLLALAGCSGNQPPAGSGVPEVTPSETAEPEQATGADIINIGVLQGPTGMGIVKLMDDEKYNIEIVGSPDFLIGKIITGELDLAAVPPNLASILYQRTDGEIQLLVIHTLGILYVLENGGEISSIGDLAGKTLYTSGKGSMPDFVIQYLLKEHGLVPGEDVVLDYSAQHADLAALIASGQQNLALLPQPFVTSVMMQNEDVHIALDITEEWKNVAGTELPMGVLIGQKSFINNNKDALDEFLAEYEESIRFVNSNTEEAAQLIAEYGILPNAQVAARALPYCNIVYIDAAGSKDSLHNLFNVLNSLDPESIGGKIPDDEFYYAP